MTAPTLAQGLIRLDGWTAAPFVTRWRRALQTADFVAVVLTVLLSLILGWGWGAPLHADRSREFLALALVVFWPVALWHRQAAATTILGQGAEEYRRVVAASAWTATVVAALAYAAGSMRARWFLLGAITTGTIMLVLERHAMRVVLQRRMAGGQPLHRVFVIAAPVREASIRESLGTGDARFRVVGSWHLNGGDPHPGEIVAAAIERRADTIVYVPLGTEDTHWTRRLGWAMEETDLSLLVSPSLVEVAGPRLSVEPVEGRAFVRVDMPRFSGPARVVKRGLDIVGASLLLLLLCVPMLLLGWMIRRDSPGPAIFKQVRVGVRSETFECWKLRTMYSGADAQRAALRAAAEAEAAAGGGRADGATFKMADDPRITRMGRWLRKFSIDELPQLVNVLRGEMSLVGPRPHPLDDVERYDDLATRRLLAKPGMTGLWQVSGRSDLDWEQAVRLDLYYVENWSLASDLLILLRTVKVVVSGSGAY
ncbi:MAG: sugar transferase [Propionicimonas sp.]